jgi:hypothetical protein
VAHGAGYVRGHVGPAGSRGAWVRGVQQHEGWLGAGAGGVRSIGRSGRVHGACAWERGARYRCTQGLVGLFDR